MGPFENGVLYVRRDQLDRVWPATIGAGWKDGMKTTDEKFCVLGQRVEITTVAFRRYWTCILPWVKMLWRPA